MSTTNKNLFDALAGDAAICTICPDLADKKAVLSPMNGNINPKVFFVAEAPGRQGADRTRRPFWGDKSGENFQVLLDSIGLEREDIFITNSVLCSPRKPSGANRRPRQSEIRNCSSFLKRTIDLIDPTIVATLGTVGLEALKSVENHTLKIKDAVGVPVSWYGRTLVPFYHPSPQVIAAIRNLNAQVRDYAALGDLLCRK
jgi:DNA polymerase